MGRRVDSFDPGGLFSKITPEGVSSVLARRISIERLKIEQGGLAVAGRPPETGTARRRHGHLHAARRSSCFSRSQALKRERKTPVEQGAHRGLT